MLHEAMHTAMSFIGDLAKPFKENLQENVGPVDFRLTKEGFSRSAMFEKAYFAATRLPSMGNGTKLLIRLPVSGLKTRIVVNVPVPMRPTRANQNPALPLSRF